MTLTKATRTFTTLRALHTLIGDALAEIERVFEDQSTDPDNSLDYPSLDVPYYTSAPHTPREETAESLAAVPAVVVAASHIVAACGQLAASVHRPFFSLVEGVKSEHLAACLQFLEATHTVEVLRAAGSDGLHVTEIARRIDGLYAAKSSESEAGGRADPVDAGKLSHILRFLATHHWLREVRPDVFANNRLSALVDSGKTLEQLRAAPGKKYEGTDGIACMVAMLTDEFFKSVAYLSDSLLPARARSASLRALQGGEKGETELRNMTPFNLAFRTELGYFEWLEIPENKVRLSEFGRGMTGTRLWEVAENITREFPWDDLPKGSVVVDVGGGVGSTSVILAKAYPHLRFVVEDRKQVVDIAASTWGDPHAELFTSGRISYQAHDFFTPQSQSIDIPGVGPVPAPSVFLVRGCTHNWPDAEVRTMLRLLRDAAGPDTKLLIVDMILPLACYDDSEDDGTAIPGAERTLAPAGSPLLANLGKASANGYLLDISMMTMFHGKERTLRELSELALSGGWRVSRTSHAPGCLWAYTTAEPVCTHMTSQYHH